MDLQEAKRALEKAAQQHEEHNTWLTAIDFHKARADFLGERCALLDRQKAKLQEENNQLKSTLRIRSREGMEDKGFESIGELDGRIAYRLSPKDEAEALFKGAAE